MSELATEIAEKNQKRMQDIRQAARQEQQAWHQGGEERSHPAPHAKFKQLPQKFPTSSKGVLISG